jgi:hypothetical protein
MNGVYVATDFVPHGNDPAETESKYVPLLRCFVELVSSRYSSLYVLVIVVMVNSQVSEADIEPRSYANIPTGINFLLAGYTYQSGNVAFAPTLPINNAKLETNSAFIAYVRSLDIWGKSGKVDIIIPEAWLSGQAEVLGEQKNRDVVGFAVFT